MILESKLKVEALVRLPEINELTHYTEFQNDLASEMLSRSWIVPSTSLWQALMYLLEIWHLLYSLHPTLLISYESPHFLKLNYEFMSWNGSSHQEVNIRVFDSQSSWLRSIQKDFHQCRLVLIVKIDNVSDSLFKILH